MVLPRCLLLHLLHLRSAHQRLQSGGAFVRAGVRLDERRRSHGAQLAESCLSRHVPSVRLDSGESRTSYRMRARGRLPGSRIGIALRLHLAGVVLLDDEARAGAARTVVLRRVRGAVVHVGDVVPGKPAHHGDGSDRHRLRTGQRDVIHARPAAGPRPRQRYVR